MTRVEFYEAKDGWRWHVKATNNEIIAESGEAYVRREDAERGFDLATGATQDDASTQSEELPLDDA